MILLYKDSSAKYPMSSGGTATERLEGSEKKGQDNCHLSLLVQTWENGERGKLSSSGASEFLALLSNSPYIMSLHCESFGSS